MKKTTKTKVKQLGLTLAELLISMALGVTLMGGVVQVFVTMQQTDRSQESMSRMQEAGRFAFSFIAQDVRISAFAGCLSGLDPTSEDYSIYVNTPVGSTYAPGNGLQGWEADGSDPGDIANSVLNQAVVESTNGDWKPANNLMDTNDALPGTDIIRVWAFESGAGGVDTQGDVNSTTSGTPMVINTSDMAIENGDLLMASDCEFVSLIQACNVADGGSSTLDITLSTNAQDGTCVPGNTSDVIIGVDPEKVTFVSKLSGNIYYIGKRGNVATNPPALFRRTLSRTATPGAPEELVEGIEDMQILYGVNTSYDNENSVNTYLPADQITDVDGDGNIDWDKVVSVRISFLIQSIGDNLVSEPQPYTFNGVIYDGGANNGALPDDRKLRRVFTSTITLRNRTLGG